MLAGAIVLVVGVPVGLAIATTFGNDDAPSATAGDVSEDGTADDGTGDGGTGDDGAADDDAGAGPETDGGSGGADALDPPDLDALAGEDAVYGQLLFDIDASEQVMMNFQDEVAEAFSTPKETPDQLVEQVREIGEASRDELLAVRERLEDELHVDGAEQVRDRYVAHLDSWADYMDAVSEDPSVLGGEGAGGGFTVVINATADAFARALETELPEDADEQVRVYADEILERGFRGGSDAQV